MDDTKSKIVIIDKPDDSFITVNIDKNTLKPKSSANITFSLDNAKEIGEFLTSISLEVEGKRGSRITIPITGNIIE